MARNTNNSWVAAVPPSGKTITNYSLENNAVEVIEVGNVLVANGVSVPDTEINMRVRAKYNDGTYGPYSNVETIAAVTTGILYQDDFTGTTIDTGKWAVTTPNASRSSVSQNGELDFNILGGGTESDYAGTRLLTANLAGAIGFTFDMKKTALGMGFSIGISNSVNIAAAAEWLAYVMLQTFTTGRLYERTAGTANFVAVSHVGDQDNYVSYKAIVIGGTLTMYQWNGTVWVSMGAISKSMWSGDKFGFIECRSASAGAVDINLFVDNFAVVSADFATLRP